MRRLLPLILVSALIASCSQLPKIVLDTPSALDSSISPARDIYPSGRWQLTHSIEATVPGGKKSGLIGVSVLSSADRTIECALMTVEGFVLFSGRYDGMLTVERVLPPFDRPGFAKGLMDDLMLLFFKPDVPLPTSGVLPDGSRVSRFSSPEGETTDVIIRDDHHYAICKYSPKDRLERSIEAYHTGIISPAGTISFAKSMMLKRHGLIGYQLDLRLVEAVPLP